MQANADDSKNIYRGILDLHARGFWYDWYSPEAYYSRPQNSAAVEDLKRMETCIDEDSTEEKIRGYFASTRAKEVFAKNRMTSRRELKLKEEDVD